MGVCFEDAPARTRIVRARHDAAGSGDFGPIALGRIGQV